MKLAAFLGFRLAIFPMTHKQEERNIKMLEQNPGPIHAVKKKYNDKNKMKKFFCMRKQ